MNTPIKKITAEDIIAYINATDINTLKAMRILIDAKVGTTTSTKQNNGLERSDLRTGDRVYFINKGSRKLNIGKVYGTVEKVNICKAKIRVDLTNAIWNVPFTMLYKD